MAGRRRFTYQWILALACLLVFTLAITSGWDTRHLVFWGVSALWWQQMAMLRDRMRD